MTQITFEELIAREDARLEEEGKTAVLTPDFGNKRNMKVKGPGLHQRFPVTLYGRAWVNFLRDENIEAFRQFVVDNYNELDWGE